jgi:aryl-alcohol dehydrogenase-like predicted oxidoreductase
MKLALGTVQFGLSYGISNKTGQTKINDVKEILETAKQNKIQLLDTASLYGQSEIVLGKSLTFDNPFKIVTKTIRFNSPIISQKECDSLVKNIEQSLIKLHQKNIYGVLFHNSQDVLVKNGKNLFNTMLKLKKSGFIKKIGFSVYTAEEIDNLLANYAFDIIQLPINIFDQRLLKFEHLKKLKKAGVEIHVRSVFLQGLLLMPQNEVSPFFKPIHQHLKKYHQMLNEKKISSIQATLNFVKQINEVDYIVIGVNNKQQLLENINAYNKNITLSWTDFAYFDNDNMLDPQKWNIKK